MNLIFYNNFHNGDIHYTRNFIKDIISKTNYDSYSFNHHNHHNILKDFNIRHLNHKLYYNNSYNALLSFSDNDNIVVNTWIGQDNAKYIRKSNKSCSLYSNYELYKDI
jgi:hypothetical protein